MKYKSLIPLTLYRGQSSCPVPRGEPIGKGEMIILLTPDLNSSYNLLSKKFINFEEGLFKKYYLNYLYIDTIGNRMVRYKLDESEIDRFEDGEYTNLSLIPRNGINAIIDSKRNIIYDFGIWNDLYFQNRKKFNPSKMAKEYLNFIYSKIKNIDWQDYHTCVYIDASIWHKEIDSKIAFSADKINNPVTSILYLLKKEPEYFDKYREIDFVFTNFSNGSILSVPGEELVKENYEKLYSRLNTLCNTTIEIDNIDDVSEEDEKAAIKVLSDDSNKNKVDSLSTARKLLADRMRQRFTDYIPEEDDNVSDEDEFSSVSDISREMSEIVDDPDSKFKEEEMVLDAIDKRIDDMIKELGADAVIKLASADDIEIEKMTKEVSRRLYHNAFTQDYDDKQLARIQKLSDNQLNIIRPLTSEERATAKVIEETSFSEAVNLPESDILHSRFINFDKAYNEKRLERDIDEAVVKFSTAKKKVFITEKKVEDTSDQLTLKETRTYHLEDENGKKMTIKFDLPKIIDENYLYINGNKKVLSHQVITKPLTKTKPDEVKLNTFYNKMTFNRKGREDSSTTALLKYLSNNIKHFNVKLGNGQRRNNDYVESLDFSVVSKKVYTFEVNDWKFCTAIPALCTELKTVGISFTAPTKTNYPIAYNKKTKEVMYMDSIHDDYGNKVKDVMDKADVDEINKIKISKRLFYTTVDIMNKSIPLALIIMHTIGLTEMLKRADIETVWLPLENRKDLRNYSEHEYGSTRFADGFLLWKRDPREKEMLMMSLNQMDFSAEYFEEMDNKDTFVFYLNRYYAHSNMSYNLDQYSDFMIDEVTREILEDFKLPTDYIGVLLEANRMLITTDYIPSTDLRNMRLRSNEAIAMHTYKSLADAYGRYRKDSNKIHGKPISIKQDEIMTRIISASLTEEESIVNPFLEIDKKHYVTYMGDGGTKMKRAFSIGRRAYTESMLGIMAITTDNAENVGIARALTLEPNILNTRGYLSHTDRKDVNKLSNVQMLCGSELLTPMGVEHDDPARTCMAVKQSKVMIPTDISEPGMITNGMDKVLPYHLSKEFAVVAEDDGVIVERKNNIVIIEYKNGKHQAIDTSVNVKKNSAAGFYITTQLMCDKKVGDKVKKNEVVGYEKSAFRKNNDDLSATMTRGPFTKIAVIPRWDCYEDSAPVTEATSMRMSSSLVTEETAVLKPNMDVFHIAKIGDKISSGDPLLKFDQFSQDAEVQDLMNIIRSKLKEGGDEFIDSTATTIKAHYTGEIVDIKIYSTVPLDDMSESMRKIVSDYYSRINGKINVLNKYKNSGDNNYYMCGQRVAEYPEPIPANDRGLLKGERVGDDGILFCFYIKYHDYIKKGDKVTAEFALKGIISNVIEPGLEPYSEYRPDEPIGYILAPHSPTARKTTGIFKTMFINKLLIEKKRQLMEYWESIRKDIT